MEIIDNRIDTGFGITTFLFLYHKGNKTNTYDYFARVCALTDSEYGLMDMEAGHIFSSGYKNLEELHARMLEAFGRIEFIPSSHVKITLI